MKMFKNLQQQQVIHVVDVSKNIYLAIAYK